MIPGKLYQIKFGSFRAWIVNPPEIEVWKTIHSIDIEQIAEIPDGGIFLFLKEIKFEKYAPIVYKIIFKDKIGYLENLDEYFTELSTKLNHETGSFI